MGVEDEEESQEDEGGFSWTVFPRRLSVRAGV